MPLDQARFEALAALGLGFAFAGLLATAAEFVSRRPLGPAALRTGDWAALASVPVLVFSAPYILVRSAVRESARFGPYPGRVLAATVLAGVWSLASGRLVYDLALRLAAA